MVSVFGKLKSVSEEKAEDNADKEEGGVDAELTDGNETEDAADDGKEGKEIDSEDLDEDFRDPSEEGG